MFDTYFKTQWQFDKINDKLFYIYMWLWNSKLMIHDFQKTNKKLIKHEFIKLDRYKNIIEKPIEINQNKIHKIYMICFI